VALLCLAKREVPSLLMSTYVFVSVTVHPLLHRFGQVVAEDGVWEDISWVPEGVGIRRSPFSVDFMIDLLATNQESGVLSCRKWAEDCFSSSSVHPVSATTVVGCCAVRDRGVG
jgi:hypothetical protein